MKRTALFLYITLLTMLLPVGSGAKEKHWFTLVNQSGYSIDFMYVKPVNSEEWSEDILGQDHLGSGESVDVVWTGKTVPKVFDVHIQYEDGEKADISGLSPPNKFTKLYIYWDQATMARWE